MADQIRDILDDKKARLFELQDCDNIVEEVAPLRAFEAFLVTRLGEWLAGEARAKNIVLRNGAQVDRPNVASRTNPEILFLQPYEMLI